MNLNPTKRLPALSIANDDTSAAQTIVVSDSDSEAPLGCTCWEDAVNIFNSKLTKDDNKKIKLKNLDPAMHPSSSVQEVLTLLKNIVEVKDQYEESRSPFQAKVEHLLTCFNQYAPVMNSLIQHHPDITSLVWGSFRSLTMIAVKNIEIAEQIGDALVDVLKQIARWESYLQLFPSEAGVHQAITQLFAQIINFLVRATEYYRKHSVGRYIKAGITPAQGKFTNILSEIRALSNDVEREVTAAAEANQNVQFRLQEEEFAKQEKFRTGAYVCYDLMFLQSTLTNAEENRDFQKHLREHATAQQLTMESFNDLYDLVEKSSKLTTEMEEKLALKEKAAMILKWLQPNARVYSRPMEWEDGTCGWIYSHDSYKKWIDSEFSNILWIYGIPGCGKSVMANFLTQNATTSITFTHFFRCSVDQTSIRATPLVLSLLATIYNHERISTDSQFPKMLGAIIPLFNHFQSGEDCPFPRLWDALISIFKFMPEFTLILDALDECCDTPLFRRLEQCGSIKNARVIVLSRYHSKFEDHLQNAIQLSMDQNSVGPDIDFYIQQEISRNLRLQPLKNQIIEKAAESAQGMFLWARLMIEYLKPAWNRNVLERRLRGFPKGLNAVYQQFLAEAASNLCAEELALRRKLFLILVGVVRPLSIDEISYTIATIVSERQVDESILLFDPQEHITRLCWPLVVIVGGTVQLMHMSVKEFLLRSSRHTSENYPPSYRDAAVFLTLDESNQYLAETCLSQLSQPQFKLITLIRDIVKQNLFPGESGGGGDQLTPAKTVAYDYACLNWQRHLTALSDPGDRLVNLFRLFLVGYEFVTWSESLFALTGSIDFGPAIEVRATLESWIALLPRKWRFQIPFELYFAGPYKAVAQAFEAEKEESLDCFLVLSRLGEYYNWRGEMKAAFQTRSIVAEGVERILGERDPFTLRSLTNLGICMLVQKLYREAEALLSRVARLQSEVFGCDSKELYVTLSNQGLGSYYQTRFKEGSDFLRQASANLERLVGPLYKEVLYAKLYLGYTLEWQLEFEMSKNLYEETWKNWLMIAGPENPATTMTQCALGVIYRKLGDFNTAEKHMKEVFVIRQRSFGLNSPPTFDNAINLAYLCRDMARPEEARAFLDLVSDLDLLETDFERYCQTKHLDALLQLDENDLETPSKSLRSLLDYAFKLGPEHDNRELLWVRLTLAKILRNQGRSDEALILFKGLVESNDKKVAGLEPLEQLKTVETALKLVKRAQITQADDLLRRENLRWTRIQTFWVLVGGPVTDTAWTPNSIGLKSGNKLMGV